MSINKKIGVIGFGVRVGALLEMFLEKAEQVEISALCDPSPNSIEYAKSINPDIKVYETYQQLLAQNDLDWIFVGSWNCQHAEHAIAAIQANKHVFCEKPLATNIEDCIAIRNAAAKSDKIFFMGFCLRYAHLYQKIKKAIEEGKIGRLISMEFNETLGFNHGGYIHSDWRRLVKNAGTHLLEKCCHDIDLAHWIVESLPIKVASFGGLDFFKPENKHHVDRIGPSPEDKPAYMEWASTTGLNPFTADKDIIDNQVAILQFANNVRATFHTNCNAGLPERRMLLLGSEGAIRCDLVSGKLEIKRIGWNEPIEFYENVNGDGGHAGADPRLCDQLQKCILEDAQPKSLIDDGIKSAITSFAIDKAMETGTVVDLNQMWKTAGIEIY